MVWLPGQVGNPLRMALERTSERNALLRIPYSHRVIHATGRDHRTVGGVGNGQHPAGVSLQCVQWGTSFAIPDPRGGITTSRHHCRRVDGRERRCENSLAVARNGGGAARNRLDSEYCLRCEEEGDCIFGSLDSRLEKRMVEVGENIDCLIALVGLVGKAIWNPVIVVL